jgi:hypothetical protein
LQDTVDNEYARMCGSILRIQGKHLEKSLKRLFYRPGLTKKLFVICAVIKYIGMEVTKP